MAFHNLTEDEIIDITLTLKANFNVFRSYNNVNTFIYWEVI